MKNDENRVTNELTKNQILGLDIAEHCGYFSQHGRGTWNFTESMSRNKNKQHKAFRDTLIEFIQTNGIRQIVAEDVNVSKFFAAMRKLSEFRGILLEVCDELNLPEPYFVPVPTVKKFATGNGKATKDEIVAAMIARYGLTPADDNEADACFIYHYYVRKFRLN